MTDQGWVAVTVSLHRELSEAMANRLVELGAAGIVTEDNGQSADRMTAYFLIRQWHEARHQLNRYVESLRELFPQKPIGDFQAQPVKEVDWAENWKQYFRPTIVSPRLMVSPPWDAPANASGKMLLLIDPGMAFGTGAHATTRLVLGAMDEILLKWSGSAPPRVLDAGTGSGILAIAAARLGAGEVVGIDSDPVAVAAAKENLARNGLEGRVSLHCRSVAGITGKYDLILANLTYNILMEKHGQLVRALAPEGYLAASGFLTEEFPEIVRCYEDEPVRVVRETSLEEWGLLVWQRSERRQRSD